MKLDFLIIGAQKAGTAFVHQTITQHPEIYLPSKEVVYFENPLYLEHDSTYLDALFKRASSSAKKGIRRPSYLYSPQCAERIRKHSPDVKLVICIREPIKRAISAYYHYTRLCLFPLLPIEEGFKKILNNEFEKTKYEKVAQGIIDYGFYHKAISKNYLQHFDRDQLHIILNEDIKHNPQETFKELFDFLGVNSNFTPNRSFKSKFILKLKSNKGVYSMNRLKLYRKYAKRVYDFKYQYEDWEYRSDISRKKSFFSKVYFCTFNLVDKLLFTHVMKGKMPNISPELKTEFHSIYKQDIDAMEKMLNVSLESWKVLK